ncbi:beta-1,3-galactosyltransferase 2-like [Pyrgilauda ruficollis]|uniref:beta-1,3-galactosyltransferase 2-like n=1 Tax=Pyrgilauda ruficollis TaxID=221976 RepID=UPI001B878E00|nr:beta-1,3-galactosyltransferase 2-like [Pyrgilauda ruficollis]
MESEKSLLGKIFTNFKQISGKENRELPPENEQSGNKATPTPTQSSAFIINEAEKCKDRTPFLVLLISTTAAEVQRRSAIRKSWGSEAAVPGADIVRLFMLGSETEGASGDVLLRESQQYHDIIQQGFLDTYNNLTLKTLMGMSWVASYCSGARFAMKTDSDVFVNTMHLIEKLLRPLPPPTQNYFTGHLMTGHSPIRNKASKWYISEEEFPDNRYHPFCSGTGYVFSGDLAAKIVDASKIIKFIHLEDVYVGFCLNAKGVEIVPPPYAVFNIHKVPFSPCAYNKLITSHHIEPHEHILYWEALQENKDTC